ncbi:MAG TPA: GerMN domain-containing protein [Vicinamibacterales bacterium]|nr:GerMN domain-containing protein [Vicinamibacterales bacterium]
MRHRAGVFIGILVVALAGAWLLFVGLPRWYGSKPVAAPAAVAPAAAAEPAPARKITATLYYVAADGLSLVGAQREVAYGARVPEQARAIVEAEIRPAPPLLSAIPAGTTLRNVFVTDRGDAFVDLSSEVRTKHSGGSLDELLTVYAIVDALTVNLPAIARVQILIDGKEVETLAGHVDLRHPLVKNLEWIVHDTH